MNIVESLKKAKESSEEEQSSSSYSTLISENLINLFNYRIKRERESAYLYKAMSLWLDHKGYFNAAKLWNKFYQEELNHAEWSVDFLLSLNIRPVTPEIEMQPNEFESLGDVIRKTLEHEIMVTKECQELALECNKESNILGYTVAHKYVQEQVEELNKANNLVDLLEVYGEDKLNLALLDHELEKF